MIRKTPKCSQCGKRYPVGNIAGMPTMIGFEMEDKSIVNLCHNCLIELGRLDEEERKRFYENL